MFGVQGLKDSAFWEFAFNAVNDAIPKLKVDLKVIIVNPFLPRRTQIIKDFTGFIRVIFQCHSVKSVVNFNLIRQNNYPVNSFLFSEAVLLIY